MPTKEAAARPGWLAVSSCRRFRTMRARESAVHQHQLKFGGTERSGTGRQVPKSTWEGTKEALGCVWQDASTKRRYVWQSYQSVACSCPDCLGTRNRTCGSFVSDVKGSTGRSASNPGLFATPAIGRRSQSLLDREMINMKRCTKRSRTLLLVEDLPQSLFSAPVPLDLMPLPLASQAN